MTYVDRGRVRILTSDDRDVTASVAELAAIGDAIGDRRAVLDGGIVGLDDAGRPSSRALRRRLHPLGSRAEERPQVRLTLFDLLHLDGRSHFDTPYAERRRMLEDLGLEGPHWTTPSPLDPGVDDPLHVAADRGAEGVIAKRRDSRYLAGRRAGSWVTTRLQRRRHVTLGGWVPGRHRSGIAALLVGTHAADGRLQYAGRVPGPLPEADARALVEQFPLLHRDSSPFADGVPSADRATTLWLSPRLVAEVTDASTGEDRLLRTPTWVGLWSDRCGEDLAA